ncbi:MAG: phage tail protein [Cyanobacteria bacterium P01_H01_bin.121]
MAEFPEVLTVSKFYLELKLDGSKDPVDASFRECSGFQYSQDVIEVCEVTPQLWGKKGSTKGRVVRTKLPGNATYTNLTLKRGLTNSMTFWNWLNNVQEGQWVEQRRDGAITIYDQASTAQFKMEFQGAWPVSYQVSDLDVTGGDYNIEEVEIAVEELKRVAA